MRKIYERAEQERSKLFENLGGDRMALRKHFMKINEDVDKKIEEILDEEQLSKYEQIKKERPRMMRPPPERRQQD